jgi:SAM-dependent methyltransferase
VSDYLSEEAPRIEKMLERFLVPMLREDMQILSVGCGAGSDVMALRRMGFKAFGVDPARLSLRGVPKQYRPFLHVATVEDHAPQYSKTYDFVYALDVIEHVGCRNFGTILEEDAAAQRCRFLSACFAALKIDGVLLLTTSNRLCPIDIGHWHRYHLLGRLAPERKKFGLSIPWHKRNFLLSGKQMKTHLETAVGKGRFSMEYVETALYPSLGRAKSAAKPFLRVVDLPLLIGSPLNPILIVKFTKLSD